jgi:hypothetical protein
MKQKCYAQALRIYNCPLIDECETKLEFTFLGGKVSSETLQLTKYR